MPVCSAQGTVAQRIPAGKTGKWTCICSSTGPTLRTVKDYQQYCPIARGAEIFAERWTPLIIRNLFLGCATFTEIREGAPGIPKTVLSERLAGLARHGVVERRPNPAGRGSTYHLTPSGQELVEVCFALGDWGAKWLDVAPEQLDSHVVLWSMARLVDRNQLPTDRVVIRLISPTWRTRTDSGWCWSVTTPRYA
jgi:DNA-binding HxlR family transcriptional regulator